MAERKKPLSKNEAVDEAVDTLRRLYERYNAKLDLDGDWDETLATRMLVLAVVDGLVKVPKHRKAGRPRGSTRVSAGASDAANKQRKYRERKRMREAYANAEELIKFLNNEA